MPTAYGAVALSPDQSHHDEEEHEEKSRRQWALLLLSLTLFSVGSHYAKHSLSGLAPAIMKRLKVERLEFGILFSFQQLPGIIIPILGGLLLTCVPLAPTAIALALILFLSSVICALAIDITSYKMLLLGRFVFGLADGLLTTVQGAIIARRFRLRNVSTAFGAMLLISRTSSFAGFALPSLLLAKFNLSSAMWFTVFMMAIPVAATVSYYNIAAHLPGTDESGAEVSGNLVDAIRSLKVPFWIIAYTFMTVASSIFSFLHFASDMFSETIGMTTTLSALLSGLLFLCAGLASPVVGFLEDRYGKRVHLLIISSFSTAIGMLLFCDVISFPIMGTRVALLGLLFLTFSLCVAPVALLSCVAILVPPAVLPLALGAYKSTENAGMAVVHVVVGGFRDWSASYFSSLLFLALVATSSVFPLCYLWRVVPVLNLPSSQIRGESNDLAKV